MKEKKKGLVFIAVAVLFGLIAFLGILSLSSQMSPSVPALKANTDIPSGTPLDRSMFVEVKIPETGMPTELMSPGLDFSTLISAKDILEGDILRKPAVFSLDDPNPSLYSARLKNLKNPNLRGIEVPIESIRGILSGMNTQDYVDLISVYEFEAVQNSSDQNGTSTISELETETIVEAAPVIGVKSDDNQNMVLIIAATKEEAEKISLHQEIGTIYAVLRPFGEGGK